MLNCKITILPKLPNNGHKCGSKLISKKLFTINLSLKHFSLHFKIGQSNKPKQNKDIFIFS